MYSVVLMMALTSGGNVADFGHHNSGCCGGAVVYSSCCGGYSSCCGGGYSSCCGGGYSSCCGGGYSCCGGGHHLFGHRHGCCGGGYSGCCGGYSGCCGGYVAPVDCGCGAPAAAGCIGGHEVITEGSHEAVKKEEEIKKPEPKEEKKEEKKEEEIKKPAPKKETAAPAPATIIVTLAADAKLSIDDAATTSTASPRVFTSPVLPVGHDYHYTLKAEMVRNGKPVVISREVTVRAGEESRVNLEAGLAGVASR